MTSLHPPSGDQAQHRHATWLELFFDLIFVVAIAKAAHVPLHVHDGHLSAVTYLKYMLIMVPIWWAWTGCTLFANRFDRDDTVQRLVSFAQMFAIIILAAHINTDFDSYYLGFVLSYAAIRAFTVLMYARASLQRPETRDVSNYLALAFSVGLLISLSSLLFDGIVRYVVMYAGIAFDMVMPLLARKKLRAAPVHAHHLPERFGLLTIILLGESVLGLTIGFEKSAWTPMALTMASCGFVQICGLWWLYFDNIERRITGQALGAGQGIIYAHLFIYSGLGGVAAMIRFAVLPELSLFDFKILSAFSVFSFMGALQILHVVYHPKDVRSLMIRNAVLFNGTFGLLVVAAPSIPVVVVGLTALVVAYVFLDQHSSRQNSCATP